MNRERKIRVVHFYAFGRTPTAKRTCARGNRANITINERTRAFQLKTTLLS